MIRLTHTYSNNGYQNEVQGVGKLSVLHFLSFARTFVLINDTIILKKYQDVFNFLSVLYCILIV